ncbi:hypothetical protein ACFQAT_22455 [Undibacterium arcticum]|uniref:Uncharacterized protein n=1 Tax=Undibacterium arcticum TaxID=1762892 RepID=A0ABV7F4H0_9BURK
MNLLSKFDEDGALTDQPTRDVLKQLLESLAAWTRQLRGESVVSQ